MPSLVQADFFASATPEPRRITEGESGEQTKPAKCRWSPRSGRQTPRPIGRDQREGASQGATRVALPGAKQKRRSKRCSITCP